MFVDCSKLGSRQLYDLLLSAVVPRPIAWVSTCSLSGVDNLAPFSFFNLFSVSPPVLGFSPGLKKNKLGQTVPKDTLKNVIETQEFVVNIVSLDLVEKMVQTSANYDEEISEFDKVALRAASSQCVSVPRLAESKVSLECRLYRIVEIGSNRLILGEILCVHVNDSVLTEGVIDVEKLKPVGRLGGELYSLVSHPFAVARPDV